MDHREIAVRVPVMNEVQLLFPSEPRKPLKSRSLYMVFLVEKDMRVESANRGSRRKFGQSCERANPPRHSRSGVALQLWFFGRCTQRLLLLPRLILSRSPPATSAVSKFVQT